MLLQMGVSEKSVEVVHRGVDVKKIDRAVSGVLRIEGKIITAGKLIPEKNFDLSIHFIKKLIDKGGNFYLDIIGSGPELSKLERLTKDLHLNERIKFYSHMSQQNLFVKMAESQFFIMTSSKQSERLPNVIKEAMYCGCICASFRTQGLDELMNSTVNGFIFDEINKDLEEFFLLTSEWQLNKIASNARSTISEKFQIKQSMLKYIEKWEGGSSVKSKI
jgi:glycosyltransferase involved in cell wall biosynthesis